MTTTTTKTVAELERAIRTLEASEIHVQTNQGTYGATEAHRKIGTGDPQFADREVYETVGSGECRSTGPDEDDAPGRMRRIGTDALSDARSELKRLREELKRLRKANR